MSPCGACEDLAWAPDGKTIAAIDALHQGILLIDVSSGAGTRVLANAGIASFRWAGDGRSLIAVGTTPEAAYPVDLTRTGVDGGPSIGPERVIVPTGTWEFEPGNFVLDPSAQHVIGIVQRYDTGLPTIVNVDVSQARPTTVPIVSLQDWRRAAFVWSPDSKAVLIETGSPGPGSVATLVLDDPTQTADLSTHGLPGPGRIAWQSIWP